MRQDVEDLVEYWNKLNRTQKGTFSDAYYFVGKIEIKSVILSIAKKMRQRLYDKTKDETSSGQINR